MALVILCRLVYNEALRDSTILWKDIDWHSHEEEEWQEYFGNYIQQLHYMRHQSLTELFQKTNLKLK